SIPFEKSQELKALQDKMAGISLKLNGDPSVSSRQFETAPSISGRINSVVYGMYSSTSAPTTTMKDGYEIASEQFEPVYASLKEVVKSVQGMEKMLEEYGAPYTPGRLPVWNKE
ncbi:MAG: glycosyl hydrolase, partial [Bacteroidota bacterium]